MARSARRAARQAAGTALLTAVALTGLSLVPATAYAIDVPLGSYSAALPFEDHNAAVSSSKTFDLAFQNTSAGTGYLLRTTTATLTGFAVTSVPATVTDSSGGVWTLSASGSTVQASAASPGMPTGATVVLPITATPPASVGYYTFSTSATGLIGDTGVVGDFARTGAEPRVLVGQHATATATCSTTTSCDTGTVGDPKHTTASAVSSAPGSMPDQVSVTIGGPLGACSSRLQEQGRAKGVEVDSLDQARIVTVTIRLDKSVVNAQAQNGLAAYGVCHETPYAFTTASGTPSTPTGTGTFVGILPSCAKVNDKAPCATLNKNGAGDVVGVVRQPGGDPMDAMGLLASASAS